MFGSIIFEIDYVEVYYTLSITISLGNSANVPIIIYTLTLHTHTELEMSCVNFISLVYNEPWRKRNNGPVIIRIRNGIRSLEQTLCLSFQ